MRRSVLPGEVLAARLANRGRGDDADLGAWLERSRAMPPLRVDLPIVNDQAPQDGARRLVVPLYRKAGVAHEI